MTSRLPSTTSIALTVVAALALSGCAGNASAPESTSIPASPQAETLAPSSTPSAPSSVFDGNCDIAVPEDDLEKIFGFTATPMTQNLDSPQGYPDSVQQLGGIRCAWFTGSTADVADIDIVILPTGVGAETSDPSCARYDGPGLFCYFDFGENSGFSISGFVAGPEDFDPRDMASALNELEQNIAQHAKAQPRFEIAAPLPGSWNAVQSCSDLDERAEVAAHAGSQDMSVREQDPFEEGVAGVYYADVAAAQTTCTWTGLVAEHVENFTVKIHSGDSNSRSIFKSSQQAEPLDADGVDHAYFIARRDQDVIELFDGPNRLSISTARADPAERDLDTLLDIGLGIVTPSTRDSERYDRPLTPPVRPR